MVRGDLFDLGGQQRELVFAFLYGSKSILKYCFEEFFVEWAFVSGIDLMRHVLCLMPNGIKLDAI